MPGKSSIEARVSLSASGLAVAGLARKMDVYPTAQNWDNRLFACGLMVLCGWGLFYNLWLLATLRGAQALCLGESDAPTWTPLSAKTSTMMFGLFWAQGIMLVSMIHP